MIAALAVLIRIVYLLATPRYVPFGDAADFQYHAAFLTALGRYPPSVLASPMTPTAYRPPAYPYLLAGLYSIFGIQLVVARAFSALLGAVTAVLTYEVAVSIMDRRRALTAGLLAALSPGLLSLSGSVLSEALAAPLALATALLAVKLRHQPTRLRLVIAGILVGLGALTRTVELLLIVPVAVAVLSLRLPLRGRVASLSLVAILAVLVVTPWTVRNALAFHTFAPLSTQDGFTLAGEFNDEAAQPNRLQAIWREPLRVHSIAADVSALFRRPGGVNEAQLDSRLRTLALRRIADHPSELFTAMRLNLLRMFELDRSHLASPTNAYNELGMPAGMRPYASLVSVVLALASVMALLRWAATSRRIERPTLLIVLVPLLLTLATVPTSGNPRYRSLIDPFIILLSVSLIPPTGAAEDPGRQEH